MTGNGSSQDHVQKVFESVWGDSNTYDKADTISDVKRMKDWSDGKITSWIDNVINNNIKNSSPLSIVDVGCGLGLSFDCLMRCASPRESIAEIKYTGLDLIPLEKTKEYLTKRSKQHLENMYKINIETRRENMHSYGKRNEGRYDLAFAFGSLHHTPSVEEALLSTFVTLKSASRHNSEGGYYIGWIINTQRPLRQKTDEFFREYFNQFDSMDQCDKELEVISEIFKGIGEALGDKEIEIGNDSNLLQLKKGKYRLQSLLYDYFLKCYYKENESKKRQVHQIFDWFAPIYYHQTSREQLMSIFKRLDSETNGCDVIDCITKENGHFFYLRKK